MGTPKPAASREFRRLVLLRQVFSYRPPLDASSLIQEVELSQLGRGRSGSHVFEVTASMGDDRHGILPIVIKFSKIADYRVELSHYDIS